MGVIRSRGGQTILEYSIVFAIIVAVLTAMGPLIKRITQGMVKLVSDEVGVQANSELRYNADLGIAAEPGHLIDSRTMAQVDHAETTQELYGIKARGYAYNDFIQTNSYSDLGFSERN